MLLVLVVTTAFTAPRLPVVPPRSFRQLRAAIDGAPQEERTTSQLSDRPSSEKTGRISSSLPFGSSKTVVTKGVTWPVFLASMVATSLASVEITVVCMTFISRFEFMALVFQSFFISFFLVQILTFLLTISFSIQEFFKSKDTGRCIDLCIDFRLRETRDFQAESYIVAHRDVRKQCV